MSTLRLDTLDNNQTTTRQKKSTLVSSARYILEQRVLELKFHSSDRTYYYYDVPPKVYDAFVIADSLGQFYNENIKGYYDSGKSA